MAIDELHDEMSSSRRFVERRAGENHGVGTVDALGWRVPRSVFQFLCVRLIHNNESRETNRG